jgi:hypothetical protein
VARQIVKISLKEVDEKNTLTTSAIAHALNLLVVFFL